MKRLISAIFLITMISGIAFASQQNVTATTSNTDPVIEKLRVSTNLLAPGVTQQINITVKDVNGADTVKSANLKIWHSTNKTEGASDSWDHYTLANGTWETVININSTTKKYVFTQPVSKHALNGTYTVKAYTEDEQGAVDSNLSSFDVSTRTGIILDTLSLTVSGRAGDINSPFNQNPQNITHDGNIDQEIYINGTNLAGPENIAVNNITYSHNATVDLHKLTGTETKVSEVSPLSRGVYPNPAVEKIYYWLDYPVGIKPGSYTGTIRMNVQAA